MRGIMRPRKQTRIWRRPELRKAGAFPPSEQERRNVYGKGEVKSSELVTEAGNGHAAAMRAYSSTRKITLDSQSSGTGMLVLLLVCSSSLAEDFRAIDGKEYRNVTVRRVEPDGLVLGTSAGISKVYFDELPTEVRKRYGATTLHPEQQASTRPAIASAVGLGQAQARSNTPSASPRVEVITHGALVDLASHLASGQVTIVDFYADWCGPCRRVSPRLEEMVNADGEIALRKIDIVNWNTPVARQYHIRSIPQVNVYNRHGMLVGTVVGANIEQVKQYVAQAKRGT